MFNTAGSSGTVNKYGQKEQDLGFKDQGGLDHGDSLPYDFSNTKYSYMHQIEQEPAQAGKKDTRSKGMGSDEARVRIIARGSGYTGTSSSETEVRANPALQRLKDTQ